MQPAPAEHRSRTAAQGSVAQPRSGDAQAAAAARRTGRHHRAAARRGSAGDAASVPAELILQPIDHAARLRDRQRVAPLDRWNSGTASSNTSSSPDTSRSATSTAINASCRAVIGCTLGRARRHATTTSATIPATTRPAKDSIAGSRTWAPEGAGHARRRRPLLARAMHVQRRVTVSLITVLTATPAMGDAANGPAPLPWLKTRAELVQRPHVSFSPANARKRFSPSAQQ